MTLNLRLCASPTFLQNREGDDGGARVPNWAGRFGYALSAAIINLHDEAGQGESRAAITGATVRLLGPRDPVEEAPERAAARLIRVFNGLGMPEKLTQLGIPKSSAPTLLKIHSPASMLTRSRSSSIIRRCWERCWRHAGRRLAP